MFFFTMTIKQMFRLLGVAFWALLLCGLIAIVCGIGWGLLTLVVVIVILSAVWRVLRNDE
ncbi:hypothetical protein [Kutzneria kofuensis]|uniref:Putative membrane protein n=1 Tax=Kutzneria kofuensis TaxID=103725 RepID=A0A7W9KEJ8_9PSEU|nr:hypothetical protein [Kutzneria kofuensis]MBB5891010.1 putative membrane protein [Kutzneria kofuensis]